jgi:hypothetical protein
VADDLPESWRFAAQRALDTDPPLTVRDETEIQADPANCDRADQQGLANVAEARELSNPTTR